MIRKSAVLTIVFTLFIVSFIYAGSIVKEFDFPSNSLEVDYRDGYSLVSLKGCGLTLQETGKPIIPFANLNVLIPPSSEITNIEILEAKRTEIAGEYFLYPAQSPRPISFEGEIPFVSPDEATYQLATEYPQKINEIIPSGNKSEYRIGGVFLYPLQYIPKERKLVLYEKLKIKINYEENRYEIGSLTQSQKQLFKTEIKDLVINPENIEAFSPQIAVSDNPDIDYIILTSTTLEPRFSPLVNWLKKTGFLTETRTTTWVNSTYTGRDLQEKIRNFVRDYFTNHGLKYILLAGDHSIIPSRQARAVVGSDVGNIPSDLYYLDLQWSWDGNNNNIFGEATYDTVDLYYDLYGGRWSFETTAEVDTMMRKFMTYVKNPDTLYQKRLLLPAALLWDGYTHMQSQDSIANLSLTGWTDREINMGSNDAWRYAVRDSLNAGFGFAHLVGHGNDLGVYISGPMYYYTDPATQTNYNKLAIVNSIACTPGNFETNDCLAEEMMKARGSAIAVMMNSRYGWGTPPSMGPSEALDLRFFHYLFSRDSIRIANCHQGSKQAYRNSALSDQVWRWCYYELNLFGEPQMMMWKDNPKKMITTFPNTINTGSQSFTVTVTSEGSPLSQANVFLWKGAEVYLNGLTNASGQVTFSANPTSSGYMYVTVVAKNKIPFEDSSQVSNSSRDVGVEAISSPGNTIPENTAMISRALVKNYGTSAQSSIPVVCSIVGSSGTLRYTNTQTITTLAAGDTFRVNFSSWTPLIAELCTVKMQTNLSADQNPGNDRKITTTLVNLLNNIGIDTIIYPLDVHSVNTSMVPIARVKNYGYSVQINFPVVCSIVNINGVLRYTNTQTITSLASGDTVRVNFSSWIPTVTEVCTVKIRTNLTGDEYTANDRKKQTITIIQILTENFETNNGNYAANPTTSAWEWGTPTSGPNAAHSGTKLWATVLAGNYSDTVNWKLTSREYIATTNNPTLKFWHWYYMEESGTYSGRAYDGGNVKISTDSGNTWSVIRPVSGYDGVGYITTYGIANESCYTGIGTTWQEAQFVLPINSGQRFFLRWHFGSDVGTIYPGWYVDDISSTGFAVFSGITKDVGVDAIIYPTGTHQQNTQLLPIARIRNFASATQTNFQVICSITGANNAFRYTNTQTITSLSANDTTRVNFAGWTPTIIEGCTVKIRTKLTSDQNTTNDRAVLSFSVGDYIPPAIPIMISPVNGITINNSSPNFIWHSVSDAVLYNIVLNSGKSEIINEMLSDTVYTPDDLDDASYSWQIRARDSVGNWSIFSSEWLFTISAAIPGWHPDTFMPASKTVKGGGALVAKGTNLYGFRGNKSNEFYLYNSTNWTAQESMPFGRKPFDPSQFNKKKVGKGGALCYDGAGKIYATKGNSTYEFWVYNIAANTWTAKAFVPSGKGLKGGTSITYKDGKVYLLAGGQKLGESNFFIYDTTTNLWSPLAMPPSADGKAYKDGSCIVLVSDTIFALKGSGKANYLSAYNISTNTWGSRMFIPLIDARIGRQKKVKDGGAMTTDGFIIFAIKGGGVNEFWTYQPGSNTWSPSDTIPRLLANKKSVPKTGAALAYADGKVYLLKGNNTSEFWQYAPYTEMSKVKSQKSKLTQSVIAQSPSATPILSILPLLNVTPNPMKERSRINFNLAQNNNVKISLYNNIGQLVIVILDHQCIQGSYSLPLNPKNLSSGIYHLRCEIGNNSQSIKLIVK